MKFLVDTNIFLEVILGQERSDEVKIFLSTNNDNEFFVTDFSIHSIGLLFFRRKRHDVFKQFLSDMIANAGFRVVSIPVGNLESVISSAKQFNLDFDDAYQYTVAEFYGLMIVSFDADFDRTDKGRKTPAEIIR